MQLPQIVVKHKKLSVVVLIVVVIVGWFIYSKNKSSAGTVSYVTTKAQKQTLTVSVTGTGQVAAANQISIKPQGSGAVVAVNVKNGDAVKAGQTLVVLDTRAAANSIASAKASVASSQANYDKVLAGTVSSDIQTAQMALDNAKRNLEETKTQQALAVAKAYNTLINSDLTAEPNNTNSTKTLTISGNYSGTTQGQYIINVYETGNGDYYSVSVLGSTYNLVNPGIPQSLGNGLYVTFGTTGTLSASTIWTINIPNTKSSNYLNNQSAYTSAQQTQTSSIADAQAQVDSAQLTLNTKTAPPMASDVAAAQAQLQSAEAALQTAETNYSNDIITAPFDGIVTALVVQKGDQAGSSAIATLVTKQQVAQLSLNEVDVAKIKLAQKATLTFDAIDGLSLTGTVAEIDTVGTVSQGVVTYNVKIALDTQDDRIKPGMSVSSSIITDVATDTLTVPNSAVKTDNQGTYIQMLDSSGKPQNHSVQVGISNDTDTQILSGLNEGDSVVTQTVTTSKTASTTSAAGTGLRIPGIGGGGGFGGNATFIGGGARAGGATAGRGN